MKPGQIQVFDGLRLTTQHVEHLQGAFHSALQDIRQILGLGQVHYGFEVVKVSDQTVTVMPGVAFDLNKNRIVSDEPYTLEVKFGEGDARQFVCVKYDQVEDGLVEGHATLIWDSCSIQLRPTLPSPEEATVTLCALKPEEKGGFTLVSLSGSAMQEGQGEKAALEEDEGGQEARKRDWLPGSAQWPEADRLSVPEGASSREAQPEREATAETVSSETLAGSGKTQAVAAASVAASSRPSSQWPVAQGVLCLAVDTGDHLRSNLLEALQKLPAASGASIGGTEFRLKLASEKLSLGFPTMSLSSRAILRGSMVRNSGTDLGSRLDFHATSQGEATITDDLISQHALTCRQKPCTGVGMGPWELADLTEAGIAQITFAPSAKCEAPRDVQEMFPILPHLTLLVTLERGENHELQVTNKLVWKDQASPEILEFIKNEPFQLSWQTLIAWKALGVQTL